MKMLSRFALGFALGGLGAVMGLALHVAPASAGPLPFHGYTYFGGNGSVFNILFFDPDGIDGHVGYFGFNDGSNPFDPKSDDHGLGNLPLPGGGGNSGGNPNSQGAGGNPGGGDYGSQQSFAVVLDPVQLQVEVEAEAVPGPGALLLLGLGVSGIAVAVGRKRRR
jgi:hypothetical protein